MKSSELFRALSDHISTSLRQIALRDPHITAKKAVRELPGEFDVEIYEAGKPTHGRTLLRNVLASSPTFYVTAEFSLDSNPPDQPQQFGPSLSSDSSTSSPPQSRNGGATECDEVTMERVVRMLDAERRRRDFTGAGFVVKQLLPAIGVEGRSAQFMFDRMVGDGILMLGSRANPNNPEFPTTTVDLNPNHPLVIRILLPSRIEGAGKRFEPIAIRGEPASETLIRDRR